MLWWVPRSLRALAENMLVHDDPDHRRLRKLVDQAFNRQRVEGLRAHIGGLCDGLLGRLAGAGPVDLMAGLARPFGAVVDPCGPRRRRAHADEAATCPRRPAGLVGAPRRDALFRLLRVGQVQRHWKSTCTCSGP